MNIFKKKKREMGQGYDETVTLHKGFEVLNYTPVDYVYTVRYANFISGAESKFRKVIENTEIDDLCDDMLDFYIDSVVNQMKAMAKEQYTAHMHVIGHHKGLLDGELVRANGHLSNLKQDLETLENEINIYKKK